MPPRLTPILLPDFLPDDCSAATFRRRLLYASTCFTRHAMPRLRLFSSPIVTRHGACFMLAHAVVY